MLEWLDVKTTNGDPKGSRLLQACLTVSGFYFMQKTYWSIIPAEVKYDEDLSPMAKLLFGEIASLCNERGYCWASNKYFAELYKSSKDSVSRWISELVKKEYVETEINAGGDRQICLGVSAKMPRGIGKNAEHNNKENNKENIPKFSAKNLGSHSEAPDPEISYTGVDEDGGELLSREKKPKESKIPKNKIAMALQRKFADMCLENLSMRPVIDARGYMIVLFAMNKGGLTEQLIIQLFEEWFTERKLADDKLAQITWALSGNNITAFKARNQIE